MAASVSLPDVELGRTTTQHIQMLRCVLLVAPDGVRFGQSFRQRKRRNISVTCIRPANGTKANNLVLQRLDISMPLAVKNLRSSLVSATTCPSCHQECVGYHLHPHTHLWYVHPPSAELTADEITKGFVAYKKRDARSAGLDHFGHFA